MRTRTLLLALAVGVLGACAPKSKAHGPVTEIPITITESGFEPAQPAVAKGEPVTLVFTRTTDKTCVTEVVFAGLGKTYELPLNQPVRVELASGVQDTLGFACGMNMFFGTLRTK